MIKDNQTAVMWFAREMVNAHIFDTNDPSIFHSMHYLLSQAMFREKEQIEAAYDVGFEAGYGDSIPKFMDAKEYWEESYGKHN
jgi:hypothetical protein